MRTKHLPGRLALSAVAAALLVLGCANLKRASSGQIGCPAEEVTISNKSTGYSTVTWTASCRGVTYYCSSAATGPYSSQYQCARETPKAEAANSVAASRYSRSSSPTAPPPFPDEALGFTFGVNQEEASAACEAAGHTWEAASDNFRCSGLATDIGVPAYSKLKFCDDTLCQIQAVAAVEPDNAEKLIKHIYETLSSKYGKPSMNDLRYPADCKGHFLSCVLEKRASWKARWKWPGGPLIYIATSVHADKPLLTVLYRQRSPEGAGQIKGEAF